MSTLNKDGSTRKKYTTKKMIMKKNRKNGHKKAWVTRKAMYPETNGYKPKMDLSESRRTGEERGQEHLSKIDGEVTVDSTLFGVGDDKVDVPEEKKLRMKIKEREMERQMAERIDNFDNFLNSIPGVKFNRDEFIHETLTTAVNTILSRVAVICHGEEELMKQLKGMMEFVEES